MPSRFAPQHPVAGTSIEVSGSITTDTLWAADTVLVVGNLSIENGVTLTIAPGVRVEFQGFFRIDVAGALQAIGTPDSRIVFTTNAPESFLIDNNPTGCWNGIHFENTAATNVPSRLTWCVLEYSKAGGGDLRAYAYAGGALALVDFSQLTVENCIFRRNVADYGGAVYLYRNASPTLVGNLFLDNHALHNASAVYCGYSSPQILNNTLINNRIHNQFDPYIPTCAILNFIGKPVLANNIIRENDPRIVFSHNQLWMNKEYYTFNNNIEDHPVGHGNIDADPFFVATGHWDDRGTPHWLDDLWIAGDERLAAGSPCIDAGDNTAAPLPVLDLAGWPRLRDDPATPDTGVGLAPLVDMGAWEYAGRLGDLNCDGLLNTFDIDPFVMALTDEPAYAATFPGCLRRLADMNSDEVVNVFDIDPFVEALIGG